MKELNTPLLVVSCLLLMGGLILFCASAATKPEAEAKYKVGQLVEVDIPGSNIIGKVTKVYMWSPNKILYNVAYICAGSVHVTHYIDESMLKPVRNNE